MLLVFIHVLHVAEQQATFVITQMQTIAFTVAPILTGFTGIALHPVMITVWVEAMLPDLHKIILVDTALLVVMANTSTGTDATVDKYRSHCHPSRAAEHPVAHVAFIAA